MSQQDVKRILDELGGEATYREIREFARKKYPTRTLYLYVLNRLRKLEQNGEIEMWGDKWRVKK